MSSFLMSVLHPTPGAPTSMMGRHRLGSGSNFITCSYVGISSPMPTISTVQSINVHSYIWQLSPNLYKLAAKISIESDTQCQVYPQYIHWQLKVTHLNCVAGKFNSCTEENFRVGKFVAYKKITHKNQAIYFVQSQKMLPISIIMVVNGNSTTNSHSLCSIRTQQPIHQLNYQTFQLPNSTTNSQLPIHQHFVPLAFTLTARRCALVVDLLFLPP